MTNEQLRAFIAVVERGSFRAAAGQVFKTQSTVSAAVRALEDEFELQLFNRDSYRPALTPAGKSFYREAHKLLGQVQRLETLGHHLAQDAAPSLALSLSAMCAYPLWLQTVKEFCGRYPQMHLSINTQHLSGIVESLLQEKADLALGPHTGLDERFEFVRVGDIDMLTVAAPGYFDTAGNRVLPQSELRGRPHILLSDTGSQAPFDHVHVIPGGQRWYVGDYQMKKALLVAGMGWARMPEQMMQTQLETGQLVALEVENFSSRSRVPIYLIRLRDMPLSELAQGFWQEMTAAGG